MKRRQDTDPTLLTGSSQTERLLKALLPDYVRLEERRLSDWLILLSRLSEHIQYYDQDNRPAGDWSPFFRRNLVTVLAEILSLDLKKLDQEVLVLLYRTRYISQVEDKAAEFRCLIDRFFSLVEVIDRWYVRLREIRQWRDPLRIELELHSAIEGHLSKDLGLLIWRIQYASEAGVEDLELSLEGRIEALHPIWKSGREKGALLPIAKAGKQVHLPYREDVSPLSWADQDQHFDYLLGEVRQVYKKYHHTLALLQQVAGETFARSLSQQDDHPPHLGLLLSFLQLYGFAQEHLNSLTGRHLDHYYREILRLREKDGVPDRAIVCFELAEHVDHYRLPAGTPLLAGVNSEGVESHYRTLASLLVTRAQVASLRTIYVGKNPQVGIGSSYRLISSVYAAPVADSSDGLGGQFSGEDLTWPIVGEDQLDKSGKDRRMEHARLGFALASPVLLLQEGEREIQIDFHFSVGSISYLKTLLEDILKNQEEESPAPEQADSVGQLNAVFDRLFSNAIDVSISGVEGWISVEHLRLEPPENWGVDPITLRLTLPVSAPAVTAYDPALLGDPFDTPWPVVKVLLSSEDCIFVYSFLKDLELDEVVLSVKVKGLRSLTLYNDNGLLDGTAPFAPFGPTPHRNSYLLVGNAELFRKKLTDLRFYIEWNNLPTLPGGFGQYYDGYPDEVDNDSFTVELSALSDYQFYPGDGDKQEFRLFETLQPPREGLASTTTFEEIDFKPLAIIPDYQMAELPEYTNKTRSGFFKWKISGPPMVFGHEIYPRLFAEAITQNAKAPPFSFIPRTEEAAAVPIPKEPFVPVIQRMLVNYEASSKINFRQLEFRENDLQADEKIFRIHPFGYETIFSRGKASDLSLLPVYNEEGYLYIGLTGVRPPQPVSLFFDIRESKKDSLQLPLQLDWAYWRGDRWVNFDQDEVLLDTTASLSTSGIVQLHLPDDLTDRSTLLPSGLYWLRVAALGNLAVMGRGIRVLTQAVQVEWVDNADPAHYEQMGHTPPITDLVIQVPEISSLSQVTGFFGGRPKERPAEFYTRVSERLRHKNRAAQLWDYERLVLERFPEIRQAKCIGSTSYPKLSPGKVKVVVVPQLNGLDPEPKAGFFLLQSVENFLKELASPFVEIEAVNPVYEKLRISCALKFSKETLGEKGRYIQQLHQEILLFICPWLKSGSLNFGGNIHVHDVLGFIKQRPYIQFVTRFSLVHVKEETTSYYTIEDTAESGSNTEVLQASRPWSVLVPVRLHQFILVDDESFLPPEIAAIDSMRLETDFVVLDDGTEAPVTVVEPEPPEEGGDEYLSLDDIL